jgi:hypothetical protein
VFRTVFLAGLLIGSIALAAAQRTAPLNGASGLTELLQGVPDVTIFVVPDSGDAAHVFLAYRTRVPRARVRTEIGRLNGRGWRVGNDLDISDRSIRPGDPEHAPVTTGAQFSLSRAPQVENNAPVVLDYVRAFQDCDHVSIVFNVSELKPYNGVDDFVSAPLVVRRVPAENAYQYEALIHDHKGPLPELTESTEAPAAAAKSAGATAPARGAAVPLLPMMLAVLFVGVGGGALVFILVVRRAARPAVTRRARL